MWNREHNLIKALVTNELLNDLVRQIQQSKTENLSEDADIEESLVHLKQYITEIIG